MSRIGAAAALLCLAVVAGCGDRPVTAGAPSPSAPQSGAPQRTTTAHTPASTPTKTKAPTDGCPVPKPVPPGTYAAVDYIDFVDANGDQYLGGVSKGLSAANRGALQLTVRCSMSVWSDANNQAADPSDGDAAFLPKGTLVYAVKGSSPLCRLMAEAEDGWHLYTATGNPSCAADSPPVATALPPSPAQDASLADCPHLSAKGKSEGAYGVLGDFVEARGVSYVRDYRLKVTAAHKGALQFRVRCSLQHLNTVSHLVPPPARNGDASSLPAGTAVYAVKGTSTACRLMALDMHRWFVFTPRPTPAGCPAIASGGR